MEELVYGVLLWLRRQTFFRVSERTLTMLMPLAVIGSVSQFLWKSVFSPDSLISNILYFDNWLPDQIFNAAWYATQGLTNVIFNLFGVFVAYFAAQYTAQFYSKDEQMAGISGMLALLLCAYRYRNVNNFVFSFNWRFLSIDSFLLALLVGFATGQVFRWLGKNINRPSINNSRHIQERAIDSFKPFLVTWAIGLSLGILANFVGLRLVATQLHQYFQNQGQNNLNVLTYIPLVGLALFLSWLGIGQPLTGLTDAGISGMGTANLSYALQHGSSWNVPNKFLGSEIYKSYGQFGGNGALLALLIAILLVVKNRNIDRISRWNFIPTLFGSNSGVLIGMPVILNPLYVLPYVFLPIINMLLAAAVIALHLVPTSAYGVLTGTPGPLKAFIATNGSWQALDFALIILTIDILLYIPVVKMAIKIEGRIDELNVQEERNVK